MTPEAQSRELIHRGNHLFTPADAARSAEVRFSMRGGVAPSALITMNGHAVTAERVSPE